MKNGLLVAVMALIVGLIPGCVAEVYDSPPPAYAQACTAVPSDAVVEGPCVYYRVVLVEGVPYRYYYHWGTRGWYYHGYVPHGSWHEGHYQGDRGHRGGGHRR